MSLFRTETRELDLRGGTPFFMVLQMVIEKGNLGEKTCLPRGDSCRSCLGGLWCPVFYIYINVIYGNSRGDNDRWVINVLQT